MPPWGLVVSTLSRIIFDPDTTPPGVPSIVSVIPVSQGRLDVTWTVVTDTGGSGLAGYNLLIDGSITVNLGIQTSYSHTGLAASSTHTYRVQSVDGNGNTSAFGSQASGTAASTPITFNPAYPRFGSYSIGGTQNASDAALAACHVNIVVHYPGWQQNKGVTWAAKCASVKALSTIGSLIFPYTIYPEIQDVSANAGQANWEVWQRAASNNLWVFQNGIAETNRIADYAAGWSKLNYTTASKLIGGETFSQWKLRWDYKLNVTGGTFSNGTSNLTVTANTSGFDGTFFDNLFAQERNATTGDTGDYDRDGFQDVLTSAASKLLIQGSHAANASFYRSLKTNALVLGNSADWPIWYPGGLTGTPLDQTFDGGLMEHMEEWVNGFRGSTMSSVLNAIRVQMDAFRPPKLGVCSVLIPSATDYAILRWWHAVCALTDTYYYPHRTTGLLAEELGSVVYDERTFSLGTAIDPVQYTARYQAGTNGTGIYRRDFANGIVLCAAPTGTYTAVSLGGTFFRLTGTLDTATNNGQAVSSVTLTAGQALVLSRTPPASNVFPLSISGRQLRDKTGTPFFLFGDTPWSITVGLTDSEVTQYLDDRQTRTVNALIANTIEHQFTANPPNTVTGIAPFTTPEDIRTPNAVYFDRALNIYLAARARGMVVLATPAYLGFGGGSEGWWSALNARTVAECQAYGAYLGGKFAALDNIIWVMGGDYYAAATLTRTQAIVAGLKSTGNANWLFTYHADRGNSSADVVNAETWLQLNAVYTSTTDIGSELETAYGVSPNRPHLYFEGVYEGESATAQELRAQAYMTVLTGGMGAFLGNNPVWKFGFGWQTALNSAGMQDRQRWATFFKAFNWYNLVPDRTDAVLTSGQGTGSSMAYAARMSDGSKIVVYTPTQKALTIALSQLVGASGTAAWYNPSTGATTSAGTTGVTGTQVFTPPSAGDWVLTITAVQAAFTPFVTVKFLTGTLGQLSPEYRSDKNRSILVANDIPGPFGENRIGKVMMYDNQLGYGGWIVGTENVPTPVGGHLWIRMYMYVPSSCCLGSDNEMSPDYWGQQKFIRVDWSTSQRLTLQLDGIALNACAPVATTPRFSTISRELQNNTNIDLNGTVMPRDTWQALQLHCQWSLGSGGITEVWMHNTHCGRNTTLSNLPTGFTFSDGLLVPGDYINGTMFQDTFIYIANIAVATSLPDTPAFKDSAGRPWIPPSYNVLA